MTPDEPSHDAAKAESFEDQQKRLLRRIASALLATWRIPAVVAVVLAALILAGFLILRSGLHTTTTTFLSRFQFTFPNAQAGRYPNGVRFTINEILDPAILEQAYNQLELDRFGVQRDAFYSALSIRPFSSTEQEIAELYRQQLADRRISFAERERLEQQLRNRLEQASRGAAELSFTLPAGLVLPPEIGRAVVQRVPRIWSQVAVEKKGVLKIHGFSAEQNIISEDTINRHPLPLAILALIEASQRLDARLSDLSTSTPGLGTVRDAVSGKSFRDLEWDVREHQLFYVNPLRAALTTYAFGKSGSDLRNSLQQRVSQLEMLEADATREAQAVGESLARFVEAAAGVARGAPERRGDAQAGAGGATIPQVGEGFIDRVIELTRSSFFATEAFIKETTTNQFDLNRRAGEYRGERNRWKEMLASLPSESAAPKEPDEATLARLVKQLQFAVSETNAKWAALSRMEAEFAANRMTRTAEIYAPLLGGPDVIRFDPIFNRITLAAALSMAMIFCLGLWCVLAAVVLMRKQRI